MKKILSVSMFLIFSLLLFADIDGSFVYEKENHSQAIVTQGNLLYEANVAGYSVLSYKITNLETNEIIFEDYYNRELDDPFAFHSVFFFINNDIVELYVNTNVVITDDPSLNLKKIDISNGEIEFSDTNIFHVGTDFKKVGQNKVIAHSTDYSDYLDYTLLMNSGSSENGIDDRVWFWGDDNVIGRVHSNDRINIKNVSSHDAAGNNGWPLFNGLVSQWEEDIIWGGALGFLDDIIPNGFVTEAKKRYLYKNDVEKEIIAPELNENDILMIDIEGNQMHRYRYQFTENPTEITIYDEFPLSLDGQVGNPIGSHTITLVDTIVTELPAITMTNHTYYHQDNEIWIKGGIQGQYIISSHNDIRILDDLTYFDTEVGEVPNQDGDHLVLSSGRNIVIAYGYIDPETGERLKPNCDDVNIYATLALDMNQNIFEYPILKTGNFTYEYQDPQPSTPYYHTWYAGTDSAYTENFPAVLHLSDINNWDLTMNTGNPLTTHEDYPFRNPLFPEANPTYERGKINFYGAMFINRRAFIHRSGSDPNNHNGNQTWNLDNSWWGPNSQENGYNKNYHYMTMPENEFFRNAFSIIYPNEGELKTYIIDLETLSPTFYFDQQSPKDHKFYVINNGIDYYYSDTRKSLLKRQNGFEEEVLAVDDLLALEYFENLIFAEKNDNQISVKELNGADITEIGSFLTDYEGSDIQIVRLSNGEIVAVESKIEENILKVKLITNNFSNQEIMTEELNILEETMLHVNAEISEDNMLELRYNIKGDLSNYYVYVPIQIAETGIHQAPELVKTSLKVYPSPFSISNSRNSGTNINFSINESQKVSIDVYNIMGQKVNTLTNNVFDKGHHSIFWNGENSNNNVVSTGVYFVRLKTERQSMVKKVLLLK